MTSLKGGKYTGVIQHPGSRFTKTFSIPDSVTRAELEAQIIAIIDAEIAYGRGG